MISGGDRLNNTGKKLRELRKSKNYTVRALSERLGVSNSAVVNYELGIRRPEDKVKKRYSQIFNMTVDKLFFCD